MREPVEVPGELAGRPFGVSEAIGLGVSRSRLRSYRLQHPFWGVRSADPLDDLGLIRAFAVRIPPRAFFFGRSAALIHRLPLPSRFSRVLPVHVGVRRGDRRVAARDVVPHHVTIADEDVVVVDGLSVTGLERTWCDLGACQLSRAELVAAGDAALSRHNPRTTLSALRAAAGRYEGRRGSRTILEAMPLLSDRSDSAPESEVRVAIIESGIQAPMPNLAILEGGRLVATPDLSWPDARLAVEYEGDHHRTDQRQWQYDIERYSRLQELGWTVIRATTRDYRDPSVLVQRVRRALADHP